MTGQGSASIGPYRLTKRLGGGFAGQVYRADGPPTAAHSTSALALKVLAGAPTDPAVREVLRQAQAAADLRSPHIIPLYGVAQDTQRAGILMAFAPGGSLGDALRAGDGLALPLAPAVTARLVRQVASALTAAHSAGLVHGDLKPGNIFVRTAPGGGPLAVLSDFGHGVVTSSAAALAARGAPLPAEQSSQLVEQLRFAAPEQLRGSTTPASDQYALAALAYLLLTGSHPTGGEGLGALAALAERGVEPPTTRNATLPPEVDAVLLRALSKQPEQRFASVAAFAGALDGALGTAAAASGVTRQFSAMALREAAASAAQPGGMPGRRRLGTLSLPLPRDTSPQMRRRLTYFSLAAVALLLLTCVLSLTLLRPFTGTSGLAGSLKNFAGPDTAPTQAPKTDARTLQAAQSGEARLQQVLAGGAAFTDPLATNSKGWRTEGQRIFFGKDSALHLASGGASNALLEDDPATFSNADLVASVTVSLVRAQPGDFAGLRFLVHGNPDGSADFYSFVVAPEGYYQVWSYQSGEGWKLLTNGYSSALTPGLARPNTLAVLAHGTRGSATLFANGRYVTEVRLPSNGPRTGGAGLVVLTMDTEAAFKDYRLYHAG